jgi:hypothetical protein
VSRSDSIGQRTRQNGVGSHIDAVSLEILALTSITERGYWGIELGGHTHYRSGRGVNQIDVGEMGLAQKNMNAPQWVQGLRMCSNYRFILQWMEKRQRTPTPANGGDRDATSLPGL